MNEKVNKFLSDVNKFMPEMHLKEPRFTYSACGPFTKNKERIQKFKETGVTTYIYKNELDKHLILLKILNMVGIREDLLLWLTNFLIKIPKGVVFLIMRLNKIYN